MPLNEVTAEPCVRARRTLEIDERPGCHQAQRRDSSRLGSDISMDLALAGLDHRQAHAVDGKALAFRKLSGERRSKAQPEPRVRRLALDDVADRFNEAGEHSLPA